MSLVDAPMALIDRILRRPPLVPPDEPVARMLERLAHDLQPGALYRSRLRGQALNRFVAAREGISMERPRSQRDRMTPIGRGVLVASFVLAIGAASVSAASQVAMPGDALYGVKLRIEQLRIDGAPGDFKDELVVASLDARLAEIQVLAERGDWVAAGAVADAAVQLATALEAMMPHTSLATEMALNHHVAVLEAVLAEAPAAAVEALQGALDASSSAASAVSEHAWRAQPGPNLPAHAAPPPHAGSSPVLIPTPRPVDGTGTGATATEGVGPAPSTAAQPEVEGSAGPMPNEASPNESGTGEDGGVVPVAPPASGSAAPSPAPSPASSPREPASIQRGQGS